MTLALFPYQVIGRDFLAARRCALLADSMGLGKTPQAIAAVPDGAPVLVVSPAAMKHVWRAEWNRWRPGVPVEVLDGRTSFRWPGHGAVSVTNYDVLPPSAAEIRKLTSELAEIDAVERGDLLDLAAATKDREKVRAKLDRLTALRGACGSSRPRPGTVLIFDEAHALRSNKTAQTKRGREIVRSVLKAGGRVWGLTGTPVLNKPLELWSLLTSLQLHRDAFRSWGAFVYAMNGRRGRFGLEWGAPRREKVQEALRRVGIRRRYEDVQTDVPPYLPPQRVLVDLADGRARALCDELAERLADLWRLQPGELDLGAIEGRIGFEMVSRLRVALAAAKLPAALSIVEEYEAAGEPLVVADVAVATVKAIGARPGWAAITGETPSAERAAIVERFQAGGLRGVAGTIRAMGVGLTLHRAAHLLRLNREWVPALNAQVAARLRRTGQTRPVLVRDLVADHPLDVRLDEILAEKEALVDAVDSMAGAGRP